MRESRASRTGIPAPSRCGVRALPSERLYCALSGCSRPDPTAAEAASGFGGQRSKTLRRTPSPGSAGDAGTDASRRPLIFETPWAYQFQWDGTWGGVVFEAVE